MKAKIKFISVLFIFFLIAAFLAVKAYQGYQNNIRKQILLEKRKAGWLHLSRALVSKVKHFKGAVGLVVEDLDTGQKIAFNQDKLLPSASLVKVPIMLSCFYAAQDKKINLEDTVILRSSVRVAGSKVLGDKPSGSVFTLEELLNPMITQSDNTAANMLIDRLGFDLLNAYFNKIGLKNTNISRKMMDFAERREGTENYTTAQEMAYLLKRIYYKKFLNKDISERCLELLGQQKINDRIPRKLPRGTFVVHKTGLENHICHDAGIVFTDKGDFLICVLVRHEDKLAQSTKKFISEVTLLTYNYYQGL
ncbi:MAG: serine hydrolase [Candidatus Omnitrophica bacterium]|nr:serine hydrolase [Candidatus Omnitrophota bacterium]